MERYLRQLLDDIRWAREHVPEPWWRFVDTNDDEDDEVFPAGRDAAGHAPHKSLTELTGLTRDHLPPAARLSPEQLQRLLPALKDMLAACNCYVIFQRAGVPDEVQYEIIRARFDQEVPQIRSTDHFFSFCDPGQDHATCQLGEFCECRFMQSVFERFDEPEWEEDDPGAEEFDFHEFYLRRKYGHDWRLYQQYPDWEDPEDGFSDEEDDLWDEEEEEW